MLGVVHGALIDTAIRTRATADEVRAERDRLARSVDALLAGGWTGPAAGAFAQAFTEWGQGAATAAEGLDSMAAAIDSAQRDFAAGDAAGRRRVAAAAAGRRAAPAAGVPLPSGLNFS